MTAMKENGLLYPSQPQDQRSEVKGQGRSVVLGLVMDPMLGIINGAVMAHYNWLLICSFSFCCEATSFFSSDSIPSGSLRLEGKLSYLYAPAWKFLGHLLLFRFFFFSIYYWPSFLEMDPKFLINWFSMLSRHISPTSWGEVSSNMNWDDDIFYFSSWYFLLALSIITGKI